MLGFNTCRQQPVSSRQRKGQGSLDSRPVSFESLEKKESDSECHVGVKVRD